MSTLKQRRKRKRAIIKAFLYVGVLAIIVAILVILINVVSLVRREKPKETTLTYLENGKVMLEEVEDFRASDYDETELKAFTKDAVKAYNNRVGLEQIKLKKLKISDGVAYMRTDFASLQDYSEFTGYDLCAGSYMDLIDAEYDMNVMLSSVNNGIKTTEGAMIDPASLLDLDVIAVKEYVSVTVPGNIEYVSTLGTRVSGANTVKIIPDEGMEDFPSVTFIFYSTQ